MMKLSKALMLSVSGLIFTSNGSAASMYDSTSFNSPDAITFVHTHTSHPEEILLSSPDLSVPGQPLIFLRHGNDLSQRMEEIKTAATCFVTDTSACSGNEFSGNNADEKGHGVPGGPGDDYDLDNEERCNKEGYYLTSCPEGQEGTGFCPYDSGYFEKCVNSCPSNYVTCEVPYYGVGEACDGKYASCEKDTERACQELNPGYVDECGKGQQLSSDRCSYDSSYGTCCNTCAGYDYTSIPNGYVQDGEACAGCDGQKHYKIKPNPCDGFMDCGSMGPDTGAKTCLSGSTTKYSNCKPCPNLGTLTSCPSPYTCTYEECSGLWYKSGCQSGYTWNADNKTCTSTIPCSNPCLSSGYTLTYSEALSQCSASNSAFFACLNPCNGERLYKCVTTGSGSGSGGSGNEGGSNNECYNGFVDLGEMLCTHTKNPGAYLCNCTAGDANGNGCTIKVAPLVSTTYCLAGYEAGTGDIQTALETCKNLNIKGITGWRLPTYYEFENGDIEYSGCHWTSSMRGNSYYKLSPLCDSVPDQNASYGILCIHD